MTCSEGALAKLAFDSSTFDENSIAAEFLFADLGQQVELIDNGALALRGTRSHRSSRVAAGRKFVGGTIRMNPSPTELDFLMPVILGGAIDTPTAGDVLVAEALPAFNVLLDRVADCHLYSTCRVARAVLQGQAGQPVELLLEIIGTSETAGQTYPEISITDDIMYVLHNGALSLGGNAHQFNQFRLLIDNHLRADFNNSQAATCISSSDRTVHLLTSTPYSTANQKALVSGAHSSAAGVAGSLSFTAGSDELTFAFANLKTATKTPRIPGKSEIRTNLAYKAFQDSSNDEVEVTQTAA